MKKKKWLIPVFFYAAALIVYLLVSMVALIIYKARAPIEKEIAIKECESSRVVFVENEDNDYLSFVTEFNDPYIIYRGGSEGGAPFYGYSLDFKAQHTLPIGVMALYYEQKQGEGWSEKNKIYPSQAKDGTWHFDLSGKKYYALRLDFDSVGSVVWQVESLVLNSPKSVLSFFIPSAWEIFLLLIMPAFFAAAFMELSYVILPYFKKTKATNKKARF